MQRRSERELCAVKCPSSDTKVHFPEGNHSCLTAGFKCVALVNKQQIHICKSTYPDIPRSLFYRTGKDLLCLTLPNELRLVPQMLDWTISQVVSIYY